VTDVFDEDLPVEVLYHVDISFAKFRQTPLPP
jgi:hypothetical protein